jgi:hypothetical protein
MVYVLLTAGCGGDAGVGVVLPAPQPPPGPRVAGVVFAPNGQLTQRTSSTFERFAKLIVDEAMALSGNVIHVGRNVAVILSLHRADGIVEDNLARAFTDDQGLYQLTLPSNTTEDTIRFIVSAGSGDNLTRAFVTSESQAITIDFISEAIVRLVLSSGGDLSAFSSSEIRDMETYLRQLAGSVSGTTAGQLNFQAFQIASTDPGLIAMLNAAGGNTPRPTNTPFAPTSTATPVPTATNIALPPTPTFTFTKVPSPTSVSTSTPTKTATPVSTPTRTNTNTPTRTATNTPTSTLIPTNTPTQTLTSTPTNTATNTPMDTATFTATNTFTPTNTPTNTLMPTNTFTPTNTSLPTNTPTNTPTRTNPPATSTPTATPPFAGPLINVGTVSGGAGATVAVSVALANSGGLVVATSNDIVYDSTQVNVGTKADLSPDCTIDAAIGAGSAANKSLLLSVSTLSGTQKKVTVGVINFQNANVIPDGALFTCNFVIAPTATGTIVLQNTSGASDADGNDLTVGGSNGTITVSAGGAPTPTPTNPPLTSTPTPTNPPLTSTPTPTNPPLTSTPTPTNPPLTSTPTPTNPALTSTPTPTNPPLTSTPTPTNPPLTSTPTATPPSAGPLINVGSANGSAGATVAVAVTLANGGGLVVATSNDIVYDSTQVNVGTKADLSPDCTIDAAIGAGSAANKSLLLSVSTLSGTQKKLTVGVINFQNANVIPNGALFTCNFVIAPTATGTIVLQNTPGASDADGNDLTVSGSNGSITVQ